MVFLFEKLELQRRTVQDLIADRYSVHQCSCNFQQCTLYQLFLHLWQKFLL